jgi:hypothetical protein
MAVREYVERHNLILATPQAAAEPGRRHAVQSISLQAEKTRVPHGHQFLDVRSSVGISGGNLSRVAAACGYSSRSDGLKVAVWLQPTGIPPGEQFASRSDACAKRVHAGSRVATRRDDFLGSFSVG